MAAVNGTDYIIKVNTGTESVPAWTAVAKQTGASLSEKTAMIDTSSKDARERTGMAGRYEASLSLDGLVASPADTGFAALRTAMRNGTLVQIQTVVGGTPAETATAVITELSTDYPDQDKATFSASFEISGEWAAVSGG